MNIFPNKVWFRTDYVVDIDGVGHSSWASRLVTRQDTQRRMDMSLWLNHELPQEDRDAARDRLHTW